MLKIITSLSILLAGMLAQAEVSEQKEMKPLTSIEKIAPAILH